LETVKESLGKEKENDPSGVRLPTDFEYHIPGTSTDETTPQGWLSKYHLTLTERNRFRIGYSEKRESLIFPVFGATTADLLMYQARYFGSDPKMPKWLSIGHKANILDIPDPWENQNMVVLVEDRISSIKVSRVTNAVTLFGSSLGLPLLLRLAKQYKKAKVWLDPDAKNKSLKLALQLGELGMATTCIFTEKDPKYYATADIRSIVDPLGRES
jgi:hypothetical protein